MRYNPIALGGMINAACAASPWIKRLKMKIHDVNKLVHLFALHDGRMLRS
ncbi:hypothetical protein SAMN04487768_0883 [Burkholderia sp. b13]|nr:hypothetical protein SAMN04487768_0883 [Burkholderia sp. b13]